jgi:acyl-CoA thioesterase FadM
VTTAYRFLRGEELLLEATMRHVFVDRTTAAKTPIPDWARAGLAPWLAAQPQPQSPPQPNAVS